MWWQHQAPRLATATTVGAVERCGRRRPVGTGADSASRPQRGRTAWWHLMIVLGAQEPGELSGIRSQSLSMRRSSEAGLRTGPRGSAKWPDRATAPRTIIRWGSRSRRDAHLGGKRRPAANGPSSVTGTVTPVRPCGLGSTEGDRPRPADRAWHPMIALGTQGGSPQVDGPRAQTVSKRATVPPPSAIIRSPRGLVRR